MTQKFHYEYVEPHARAIVDFDYGQFDDVHCHDKYIKKFIIKKQDYKYEYDHL